MKPKKLVHCAAIGRSKMLFETENKAENFIKFNSEDILEETGKAPTRSYYCMFCCGWHVTSNPRNEVGERIEKDLQKKVDTIIAIKAALKKQKADTKETSPVEAQIKKNIAERVSEFNTLLLTGRFDEAEDQLDNCEFELNELDQMNCRHDKVDKLLRRERELLRIYRDMQSLSETGRKEVLLLSKPNKIQRKAIAAIQNIEIIEQLNSVNDNRDMIIACSDDNVVNDIISACKAKISKLSGEGVKKAQNYFSSMVAYITISRDKFVKLENHDISAIQEGPSVDKTADDDFNKCDSHDEKRKQISTEFAKDLVSLIDRIMMARSLLEDDDYNKLEEELEVCYLLFDQLGVSNDETQLIRNQLDELSVICANRIKSDMLNK